MGKRSGLESTLVGVAGEYFVAAELTMRGHVASITLRNSRGIDIIATRSDGSRSISIQVKTSSGKGWILSRTAEGISTDNHFYAFVLLRGVGTRPDFHIVPSPVVAEYVTRTHRDWLAGTKVDGSPRKDSAMRTFHDREGEYLENWKLLDL